MYKTLGINWLLEYFCPASAFATADSGEASNPQRFIHVTVGNHLIKKHILIYLILDTNVWIYLANGFDPTAKKSTFGNHHFELLSSLIENSKDESICVLTNCIVLEEWKRNKSNCETKLNNLEAKLKTPNNFFSEIKRYVVSDIKSIEDEFIAGIEKDIKENELHVKSVEEFLHKDCRLTNISDDLKIKIFELSLTKEAPFHNNKNNVADAAILLSAAEFLKDKLLADKSKAIFVSNNVEDFANSTKSDFHQDIINLFDGIEIKFERFLPSALNLSQTLIDDYQKYQAWLNSITFHCTSYFCSHSSELTGWGYLDEKILFKKSDSFSDPNQLSLFPELDLPPLMKELHHVESGNCVVCNSIHIICPSCGELICCHEQDEIFECEYCQSIYIINWDDKENACCLFQLEKENKLDEEE